MAHNTHNQLTPPLRLSFCLTNPPFDDVVNGDHRSEAHRRDGRAYTPLTYTEGWYPGGEVGFIRDIFLDQVLLALPRVAVHEPSTFFTTMAAANDILSYGYSMVGDVVALNQTGSCATCLVSDYPMVGVVARHV